MFSACFSCSLHIYCMFIACLSMCNVVACLFVAYSLTVFVPGQSCECDDSMSTFNLPGIISKEISKCMV